MRESQKLGWLSRNSGRKYPLSDTATALDNAGVYLPDDLITDLRISWPKELGQYAFISFASVTSKLVSIGITASTSATLADTCVPLANVVVASLGANTKVHKLSPMAPGVVGFVSFGDTNEILNMRFSTPAQALLAPATCVAYATQGVTRIAASGAAWMTGAVSLIAGNDITIREVNLESAAGGPPILALAIGLTTSTASNNVAAKYVGSCNRRPENGDCPTGDAFESPIRTVNGVPVACDKAVTIRFVGAASAAGSANDYGVNSLVVGYAPSLDAICASKNRNPNIASVLSLCSPALNAPPAVDCEELPVSYPLTGEQRESLHWNTYKTRHTITSKGYSFADVQNPAESGFTTGFATYDSCGYTTSVDEEIGVTVTCHLPKPDTGSSEVPINLGGGLVINFLRDAWLYNSIENKLAQAVDPGIRVMIDVLAEDAPTPPGHVNIVQHYYVVRLAVNGVNVHTARITKAELGESRTFTLGVQALSGATDFETTLNITATALNAVTGQTADVANFSRVVNSYGPPYGKHGIFGYSQIYSMGDFTLKRLPR